MTLTHTIADVIIVGAGSAGCVLADRLSEDPARKVLLLEAGPDYPTLEATPPEIVSGHALAISHDWGMVAESGAVNRTIPIPRPKLVGGSSATNATFALRGLPADYDAWEQAGNRGWSFSNVLPFFKRIEADRDFDEDWHGKEGPIPIRRYPAEEMTPVQAAFLVAAQSLGHGYVSDHNTPGMVGVGPIPMNTEAGIRQSAALTYLARARGRRNFSIRTSAMVGQILFDGHRACGVELASETLLAGHIILATGAYSSPMMLMRSGIGPAEHLHALGISVRLNLPGVGCNLMDHPIWAFRFASFRPHTVESVPMFQTMLTLRTEHARDVMPFDAQIFPTSNVPCGILQSATGGLFTLCVSIMRPRSTGKLLLSSVLPSSLPRVQLNYFSAPQDMPIMLSAIQEARRLVKSSPLAELISQELYPGPKVQATTDLEATIRQNVNTYHHACGTCRMGPDSDPLSVVNAAGEVRGFKGLSVIDASILPQLPSANIHLTTLMVAERCAQLFATKHAYS
jgi:choline dehydrogenase